ncbi:MAG: M48 family metallopeptidase [bacterium]|nr:M48 family metallopeptidase [bacterium]
MPAISLAESANPPTFPPSPTPTLNLQNQTNPGNLPDAYAFFTPEQVIRAKSYQRARLFLGLNRIFLEIAFLLFLVLSGVSLFFESIFHRLAGGRYFLKLIFFAAAAILVYFIISFPLDWQSFRVEQAFQLSHQNVSAWITDLLKSKLIFLVFFLITIVILYRFIIWDQDKWWIPAGIVVSALILFLIFLAPVILDPLFGNFDPLPSGSLKTRIELLTHKAGIDNPLILVEDSHRRTAKANAYFTGLGKTQRVVLYDNLIEQFFPEEVESVLAHELGHYKKHHTWKGGILAALLTFPLFYFLSLVLKFARRIPRLGIHNSWEVSGLPLMLLALVLVTLLSLPAQNWVSRTWEREADCYALELTRDADSFISSERRLALKNLSDPAPSPLIVNIFYTHPPVMERIRMAAEWGK